jgi:4'-phosphopantetheinyl transferase
LRKILSRYLITDPAEITFSYNQHGKPFLKEDKSRQQLMFNLSHSNGMALYAITQGKDIGVDIEHVKSDVEHEDIAKLFFSQEESSRIRSFSVPLKMRAFYNCWTRKEAYLKARGEGLIMPLGQFNVTLAPGEPAAILNNQWAPDDPSRWSLHELDAGQQYVAALAIEGNPTSIKCMSWRI